MLHLHDQELEAADKGRQYYSEMSVTRDNRVSMRFSKIMPNKASRALTLLIKPPLAERKWPFRNTARAQVMSVCYSHVPNCRIQYLRT